MLNDIGATTVKVRKIDRQQNRIDDDWIVQEEPLEIRLKYKAGTDWKERQLSITMRTPGEDHDLVAGFLFHENIILDRGDIQAIRQMGLAGRSGGNIVEVVLEPGRSVNPVQLERHFFTNSSCGVCGKASIELLYQQLQPVPDVPGKITSQLIRSLPDRLGAEQKVFRQTGGLHASALFDRSGRLLTVREDVGRHNALDKLVGHMVRQDDLDMSDRILLLSGRISFELVQKAIVARIPVITAVGAPSSMAVDLAEKFNISLIGFARENGFNIYTGAERIHYD